MKEKILQQLIHSSKGVTFDMDGVIVDMEEHNYLLYKKILKRLFNADLTLGEYQCFFYGRSPKESIPLYLQAKKLQLGFDFEEFVSVADPIKIKLLSASKGMHLIKGITRFLEYLKSDNKQIVLATSASRKFVPLILNKSGTYDFFDFIFTMEDVNNNKPDPDIYNLALIKIRLEPQEVIIFEDSPVGLEAASKSDARVMQVGRKEYKDYVSIADFTRLI